MSQAMTSPGQSTEAAQPHVRVMRLYKPSLQLIPSMQPLSNEIGACNSFSVSPFLLLPDSFGEIFVGQKFTAYISVVNGTTVHKFYEVVLSVRLQTTNSVYDLGNQRLSTSQISGKAAILKPSDVVDFIVEHQLQELGTYTLRVTVQYLNEDASEPKVLRKFYRFNVLHPLSIATSSVYMKQNNSALVQYSITNSSTYPLYIEKALFIPLLKNVHVSYLNFSVPQPVTVESDTSGGQCERTVFSADAAEFDFETLIMANDASPAVDSWAGKFVLNTDAMPVLLPSETYSYCAKVSSTSSKNGGVLLETEASAFKSPEPGAGMASSISVSTGPGDLPSVLSLGLLDSKSHLGIAEVHWSLPMGEKGISRSDAIVINPDIATSQTQMIATAPSTSSSFVHLELISHPDMVILGEEFPVYFTLLNTSAQPISITLKTSGIFGDQSIIETDSHGINSSNRFGLCITRLKDALLGPLSPGETLSSHLMVCGLATGLQCLGGLRVNDSLSGKEQNLIGFLEVMVCLK